MSSNQKPALKKRYFGTDGIRGRVGDAHVDAQFALKLGRALGAVLSASPTRSVVIGKDTRISGYLFESALEAGLSSAGVDIKLLGPMPTPAVAYLTQTLRASAGIVISASHNPYYDNGFKFFSSSGKKLNDEDELKIEAELERPFATVDPGKLGKAERIDDAMGRYIEFCKSTIDHGVYLSGLKIVVDCANGATYQAAPTVLSELGAKIVPIGVSPDGLNINLGCGSTDLSLLTKKVLSHQADLGIAFDGDGDRVLMVDHEGQALDGDELLFVMAKSLVDRGCHPQGVVGTLMSNLGLQHALSKLNIDFHRAQVGDRYVLEDLRSRSWVLGGESSGHLINLDRTSTGDGIISALAVLEAMVESGRSLKELKQGMDKYPQVMINVPTARSVDPSESEAVSRKLTALEAQLGDSGRVILRASGTEPLIRVTVEGEDAAQVQAGAEELAAMVSEEFSI